eukprot:Gb_30917 [translate_table: standard]
MWVIRVIGGFLSHCGWKSTLESLCLGVPMITWPMFVEQPFNLKLLIDYLGIGIQLCLDMSVVLDDEHVQRVVRRLLAEEEGKSMKCTNCTKIRLFAMEMEFLGLKVRNRKLAILLWPVKVRVSRPIGPLFTPPLIKGEYLSTPEAQTTIAEIEW